MPLGENKRWKKSSTEEGSIKYRQQISGPFEVFSLVTFKHLTGIPFFFFQLIAHVYPVTLCCSNERSAYGLDQNENSSPAGAWEVGE